MSGVVFLAVLAAAVLHAGWNALVKGGADKTLGIVAVVLGHAPAAALAAAVSPLPAPQSWPFLAAGVGLHLGYQAFLATAYRIGDLTQVYPIARGSAPLLVAGVSVVFLGAALSPRELLAVAIIGAGIMSLALVRRRDGLRNRRAAATAFLTGCFIAGYSLVDGWGARASGTSLGFFAWLALINVFVLAAVVAATRPGMLSRVPGEARRLFVIGGTGSFVAYALVTWAFTQAPIALVSALRETSIVVALVIGVVVLKERLDLLKLAATMVTLFGAALLRLAR